MGFAVELATFGALSRSADKAVEVSVFRLYASTPQLPFNTCQKPSNRDHKDPEQRYMGVQVLGAFLTWGFASWLRLRFGFLACHYASDSSRTLSWTKKYAKIMAVLAVFGGFGLFCLDLHIFGVQVLETTLIFFVKHARLRSMIIEQRP